MKQLTLALAGTVFSLLLVGCAHQETTQEFALKSDSKPAISRQIATESNNQEAKKAIQVKSKEMVDYFTAVLKVERKGEDQCNTAVASPLKTEGVELIRLVNKVFKMEEVIKQTEFKYFYTQVTKKIELHEKVDKFNRPLSGLSCDKYTYLDAISSEKQNIALAHFFNWYLESEIKK